MKVALILSLSLMFVLFAFVEAKPKCDFEPTDDHLADFIKHLNCSHPGYKPDEKHEERFKQFKKCHKRVKGHGKNKTHTVSFNRFCHMTDQEINRSVNRKIGDVKHIITANQTAPTFYSRQLQPTNWSWVDKGAVTSVKDQGACGSCWAFAAVAAIESAYFIKYGRAYNFSTQQYVDCTYGYGIGYNYSLQCSGNRCVWVSYPYANKTGGHNWGCNGGDPTVSWIYNQQVSQLVTWECYPYTSGSTMVNGNCQSPSCAAKVSPVSFVVLPSNNETALLYAVWTIGPVACVIDADPVMQYRSGIVSTPSSTFNHVILVVGFGTTPSGVKFWQIKNSWGPDWGDKGFLYVQRDVNALSIATYCSYPKF